MQEKSFINHQFGIKFKSYIDHKCRVWFKAKEVAQILNYKDTDDAIRKHTSENHKKKKFFSANPANHRVRSRADGLYLLMKLVFMN